MGPLRRTTRFAQGLVIGAALTIAACQTPSHREAKLDAQQHWTGVRANIKLQLAEQAYESKQFDEAVRLASESIALNPSLGSAYELTVQAQLELGREASARRMLDTAAAAGVRSPGLEYTMGVVAERAGRLEAALEHYEEARRLDPTQSDFLIAQAECLVELERPREALALLEANRANVDDAVATAVLGGQITALLGKPHEAAAWYREALAEQSGNPSVAAELGLLLVRLERYDEAVSVLAPLVQSAAGPMDRAGAGAVRRALATSLLRLKRPAEAVDVLEAHAAAQPTDLAAQLLLAEAALATGDSLTALRAADAARRHDGADPRVRLTYALVQWQRRNYGPAATALFDLLSDDAENVQAHCLLGEVLAAQSQFTAARRHFDQALSLQPTCAWAVEALRVLAMREKQADDPPPTKLTSAGGH